MTTLKVDILNPKAIKLLEDLAELNLISIHVNSENKLPDLLKRLRSKSSSVPSLDEITKEVELVRSNRHAK